MVVIRRQDFFIFGAQKNAPAKLAGTFFFYWLTALTLRNGRKDVTCHVQPCSP